MAATTGIGWTDGTVNFWIGCTHAGPGCEGCYAEVFAKNKFNVTFGPGEERRKTKAGFTNPFTWQRKHEAAKIGERATMITLGQTVPVPVWVFCNSLSDFFDNEIDPAWRAEAWAIIKRCHSLRWQIVTKRIGNVAKMLPVDWYMGGYDHVGIIGTMVTQQEYDRDVPKLVELKRTLVKWIGVSIEPQLGPIVLGPLGNSLDWIITGGESRQGKHAARPYDMQWAHDLIAEGAIRRVPVFVKQMGDNTIMYGQKIKRPFGHSGADPEKWPPAFRVQQMPTVYDADPMATIERCTVTPDLFT